MEVNRTGTSEKVVINAGIRTSREFGEVQGVGFTLTLVTQGQELISTKRELVNKLLTSVLLELSREEEINLTELKRKIREAESNEFRGMDIDGAKMDLDTFYNLYIHTYKQGKVRDSTWKNITNYYCWYVKGSVIQQYAVSKPVCRYHEGNSVVRRNERAVSNAVAVSKRLAN